MKQDIKYTGFSANPSDHEAPDGDLTTALNLVPEDGQIKPIFQPEDICTLPRGCKFIYIHKTAVFIHYIAIDPIYNRLYWINASEATGTIVREYIEAEEYEVGDVVLHQELGYVKFTAHHTAGAALTGYEITSTAAQPTLNILRIFDSSQTIRQVNSIGNTLVVLSNGGINYFLWKTTFYHYIGNHIPELPLSFGLQGEPKTSSEFTVGSFDAGDFLHVPSGSTPKVKLPWGSTTNMDNNITTLTNSVLAEVNKFIKEQGTDKGKFIMPFFVCYAYRLYDDTLTMHSAPVLMVPNSGAAPQVNITSNSTTTGSTSANCYTSIKARVGSIVCDLDYACIDSAAKTALQDWSDIVKSIDIFISAPIYTYDQSGRIQGFEYSNAFQDYTISFVRGVSESCSVNNGTLSFSNAEMFRYRKTPVFPLIFTSSNQNYRFILPTKTDEQVEKEICECCNFYLLKSINIDAIECITSTTSTVVNLPVRIGNDRDIKSTRKVIDIEEDYLEALVAREEMEMAKEFDSHDIIIPTYSYVYNQRLNLANINKSLVMQFNPATFVPYFQPENDTQSLSMVLSQDGTYVTITFGTNRTEIYMKIVQDSKVIVTKSPSCAVLGREAPFIYFYYPNGNAENAYIYKEGPGFLQQEKNVITLPLKKHVNLNGTFFFDGWNPTLDQTGWITGIVPHGTIPSLTTDNTIPLPNKLYTSEINNPFYFPTTSIVTIGTGTILGMSTASKALSQGQFGQFPLYVFTTDGVWALEVSSAGTFYARQPITRDICTNPDSITQLDSAVIFATDRGLMLLQGSEAICVTDGIATEHPFNVLTKLPHAADLHAMLDHNADTCLPTQPFLAFLSGCRIIYDYVHQHIIVFNTNYTYAYVFSLKSKLWGMMYSNLASTLNSYPNALAMSQDNHLVSFSDTDQDICKGLLITRPLKLGDGDTLKSIHTLLQRGNFQRGDVNTVLYGSRDLVNWHIIATSVNHEIRNLRGTPYKYFRVASVATLTPDKSIYGITVDVEPRHTSVLQ